MAAACDKVKDRFVDLPDELLRHVVSFLPVDDALQTCVLDTRWRDHWRRRTSLLVRAGGLLNVSDADAPSGERLDQLVKLFIKLRGHSPLVKCKIAGYPGEAESDEWVYTYTKLLIEYALACQVEELRVSRVGSVDDVPLISQHLKTIHLKSVNLEHSSLDFSRCPVLEDLKMSFCKIHARRILSKSLKRMCITRMSAFSEDFHTRIFAPGLTELQLLTFQGLPPFLEYMPFLVTAYVWVCFASTNFCRENHECGCHAYPVEEGVLLNGLSNAVNLELISDSESAIFRWDLEWCPIFDKLKTLLLSEWFRAIDLVCILQHSPVLEVLTLQLGNVENSLESTLVQETTEQSFVGAHLKVVNIESSKGYQGIYKVLKILSTCGVVRDRICIKDPSPHYDCFSFSFQQGLPARCSFGDSLNRSPSVT